MILIGNTQYELSNESSLEYAQVVSARLRRHLIVNEVLDNQEALFVLESAF